MIHEQHEQAVYQHLTCKTRSQIRACMVLQLVLHMTFCVATVHRRQRDEV